MLESNPDKRLTKHHFIWVILLLSTIFSYAGVQESILTTLKNVDFIVNFIFNGLQIWLLLSLSYHLVTTEK